MIQLPSLTDCRIGVLGLGYVGLPLAVRFASTKTSCSSSESLSRHVIGFDINSDRIKDLNAFKDVNNDFSSDYLRECSNSLTFTNRLNDLNACHVFIVTVPTPVNKANVPDLSILTSAFQTIGEIICSRDCQESYPAPVVIVESTVYPGATRELAENVLHKQFELTLNSDYLLGFSPERINPGDKLRTIGDVVKVTSGSNEIASKWIDALYSSIISAGTHRASSIEVAEADKIIENTQRDLNIALMNELSIIFDRLDLDTREVLAAASTKWNFVPFSPGLVGGHCIGVDPYYLTHKALELGYSPQIVLAGRRINDEMAPWVANKFVKHIFSKKNLAMPLSVLILGFTFKANCNDIRNTKVFDLVSALKEYGILPTIYDPVACPIDVREAYDIKIESSPDIIKRNVYSSVLVCVPHYEFVQYSSHQWKSLISENGFIFDLTGIVPQDLNPIRI